VTKQLAREISELDSQFCYFIYSKRHLSKKILFRCVKYSEINMNKFKMIKTDTIAKKNSTIEVHFEINEDLRVNNEDIFAC